MRDVTDASFTTDVLERSDQVPVVVDLWAPWCGPCKTLGPILERVVDATGGAVELAKVNVDENPRVASTFRVQSIPAVFALRDRRVVDSFVGALPEEAVEEFVGRLAPAPPSEVDQLVEAGDEASLRRALEVDPGHAGALTAMAGVLVERGDNDEALSLLARAPESPESRRIAALARLASASDNGAGLPTEGDLAARLDGLLDRVRQDEAARQEFVDLLEAMGPDDPRTGQYRRALAARLF